MKLAPHRSIIFWSGILVMTFIGWAWRDSFHHEATLISDSTRATSHNGGLAFAHFPGPPDPFMATYKTSSFSRPDWSAFQPLFFLRGERDGSAIEWDRVDAARNAEEHDRLLMKNQQRNSRLLFIPHWLLLLTAAILWCLLLLWRVRRRNRLSNPAATCL